MWYIISLHNGAKNRVALLIGNKESCYQMGTGCGAISPRIDETRSGDIYRGCVRGTALKAR
jgi:hypothetical protein